MIPILVEGDEVNEHNDDCRQAIFSGTPLVLFLIATMIQSKIFYRFICLATRGWGDEEFQARFKKFDILLIVCVVFYIIQIPMFVCYYCLEHQMQDMKDVVNMIFGSSYSIGMLILTLFFTIMA